MQEFIKNKDGQEKIFQYVNFQLVNEYLEQLMEGLTAKVFRTYRACYEFQKLLENQIFDKDLKIMRLQIDNLYLDVAKILNHVIYKLDKKHQEQVNAIRQKLAQAKGDKKKEY